MYRHALDRGDTLNVKTQGHSRRRLLKRRRGYYSDLRLRVSGRSGVRTFSLISTAGEEAIDNSVTRAVPGEPDGRGARRRIGDGGVRCQRAEWHEPLPDGTSCAETLSAVDTCPLRAPPGAISARPKEPSAGNEALTRE
ncbi:hypothetical protein Q8A67_020221 [Cirrhinus molitorella]|uniref:Uncharacterized protein n=1 Tax=Cirrhinus molitorella TaxID=172907 RepID=A0AA88TF70_9TELE|nr:hypothetical protein Q8A67_020221 [Cirrhinus molitorella]